MVHSALPVAGDPEFAMNLLFPSPGTCRAHGLVKRSTDSYGKPCGSCPCGQVPAAPNPPRGAIAPGRAGSALNVRAAGGGHGKGKG